MPRGFAVGPPWFGFVVTAPLRGVRVQGLGYRIILGGVPGKFRVCSTSQAVFKGVGNLVMPTIR